MCSGNTWGYHHPKEYKGLFVDSFFGFAPPRFVWSLHGPTGARGACTGTGLWLDPREIPCPASWGQGTFTSPSSGTQPPCSHILKSPLRAGKMKPCRALQQACRSTLLSAHFSRLFESFLFLYSMVAFIPNKSGGTFFKEQVTKPTFLRKTFLQTTVNIF